MNAFLARRTPFRLTPDQVEHDGELGAFCFIISTAPPPNLFPTFHPHAILAALPLPDGSRTFRAKREGMLLTLCPNVGRRVRGGGFHRGSAGGRCSLGSVVQSQPPGRAVLRKEGAGTGLWRTWSLRVPGSRDLTRAPGGLPGSGSVPERDKSISRGLSGSRLEQSGRGSGG